MPRQRDSGSAAYTIEVFYRFADRFLGILLVGSDGREGAFRCGEAVAGWLLPFQGYHFHWAHIWGPFKRLLLGGRVFCADRRTSWQNCFWSDLRGKSLCCQSNTEIHIRALYRTCWSAPNERAFLFFAESDHSDRSCPNRIYSARIFDSSSSCQGVRISVILGDAYWRDRSLGRLW